MIINNTYSFLTIGKTQESTEGQSFKRYVGIGSSFVIAINPTKKELEDIYGREVANDPEYVVDTDNGKEARITFIVKTDPKVCDGIESINRIMFTLRNAPAYNRDQTKVQVIDKFGNSTWASVEDAKAGKKLLSANGQELMIDASYRMACVGEADLVEFLKVYLGVGNAFNYVNGSWVEKDNTNDYVFGLEHVKDYFKGDFSEIKEAIALQPNNKIKLLYGVRTTDDGKQYQAIAARHGFFLPNYASSKAFTRVEKELNRLKDAGSYANYDFRVQELAEYTVEPTNLSTAPISESDSSAMPWD